jgi:hypothetical protein
MKKKHKISEASTASETLCIFKNVKLTDEGKCTRICISLVTHIRQESLDRFPNLLQLKWK